MKFGKTKIAKETFFGAKKSIKVWSFNVDNIIISKLAKTKTNSKYLIWCLYKHIKPLVLIIPKMSGFVQTFKVKDKIKKYISFCIDDDKY